LFHCGGVYAFDDKYLMVFCKKTNLKLDKCIANTVKLRLLIVVEQLVLIAGLLHRVAMGC